jgi:hypothetical protein
VAACNDEPLASADVDLIPAAGQTLTTETVADGNYNFSSLSQQAWTIKPSIQGQQGGAITADDAIIVLDAAVGKITLTPQQHLAADVTGNGAVTSTDAALIIQFSMGMITTFPVADLCGSDWVFVPDAADMSGQQVTDPVIESGMCIPGTIVLDPLTGQVDNRNFRAILFGDVDESWPNPGPNAGG